MFVHRWHIIFAFTVIIALSSCVHPGKPSEGPLSSGDHAAIINGSELHYHVHGRGPLCVVHPGGPGLGWDYLRMSEVERFMTLVYLEPVGSGVSGRLPKMEDYTTARYVEDLEGMRRHLGLEKVCLIGHSHGGLVAEAYAVDHADNLSALILYGAYPVTDGQWMADLMNGLRAFENKPWYPSAMAAFGSIPVLKTDDEEQAAWRKAIPIYVADYDARKQETDRWVASFRTSLIPLQAFFLREAPKFDVRGRLDRIKAPTLLIFGDADASAGPKYQKMLHEGIPGARLVVIKNSGHFSHFEMPGAFAAALKEFIGK